MSRIIKKFSLLVKSREVKFDTADELGSDQILREEAVDFLLCLGIEEGEDILMGKGSMDEELENLLFAQMECVGLLFVASDDGDG